MSTIRSLIKAKFLLAVISIVILIISWAPKKGSVTPIRKWASPNKVSYIFESSRSLESPKTLSPLSDKSFYDTDTSRNITDVPEKSSLPKKIVYYTKFFQHARKQSSFMNYVNGCLEPRCIFTSNKAEAEDADAVLFHADDIVGLPKTRHPHQRYVWMTLEAPWRPGLRFGGENTFNWTATYSRESDIFRPYGYLVPLQDENNTQIRSTLLDKNSTTYQNYLQDLKNNVSLLNDPQHDWSSFLSRPKIVAWMASRCTSWSKREQYIKELQKHMDVDIYGGCGPKKCPRNQDCHKDVLAANYSFYLAFENQLCVDYITEKLFRSLKAGMVPVVLGGANYEDFLPPNSFINAYELTPKELAKLLSSIASSPHELGKYNLWRQYWKVELPWFHCALCYKLHNDDKVSIVKDVKHWWNEVNKCKKPKLYT